MRVTRQQPFPGAAPPISKSYHRQLVELAIAGIILGAVFLLFWQGVLRFGTGPATWDESYCRRLLTQYEPTVQTELLAEERAGTEFRLAGVFANGTKTVEMIGANGTVATCGIIIISDRPAGGFGDAYNCTVATISYKSENTTDWLMTGVQTELAPEFAGTLARFSTAITYYNPNFADAVAMSGSTLEKLASHSCA